jgi:hypothetical protein
MEHFVNVAPFPGSTFRQFSQTRNHKLSRISQFRLVCQLAGGNRGRKYCFP